MTFKPILCIHHHKLVVFYVILLKPFYCLFNARQQYEFDELAYLAKKDYKTEQCAEYMAYKKWRET